MRKIRAGKFFLRKNLDCCNQSRNITRTMLIHHLVQIFCFSIVAGAACGVVSMLGGRLEKAFLPAVALFGVGMLGGASLVAAAFIRDLFFCFN